MLSKGTHEMRGEELTAQAKPSRGGDAQVSSRHNEEVFPADTEGSHIFMFPCYLPGCSSPSLFLWSCHYWRYIGDPWRSILRNLSLYTYQLFLSDLILPRGFRDQLRAVGFTLLILTSAGAPGCHIPLITPSSTGIAGGHQTQRQ